MRTENLQATWENEHGNIGVFVGIEELAGNVGIVTSRWTLLPAEDALAFGFAIIEAATVAIRRKYSI